MNAVTRHSVLPPPSPRLLSRPEAAAYAGVGTTFFDRLIAEGLMPKPLRLATRTLWDVRALDAAIDDLRDSVDSPEAIGSDNDFDR